MLAYSGNRSFDVGNYISAIKKFNLAVKKPLKVYEKHEIYSKIGSCYYHLFLYEKAIIAYRKSIEIKANDHKTWSELGVAYRRNGNFKEAVQCYEKSILLNPDYAHAHTNLGANYTYLNEPEKAIEILNKAIELDPSHYVPYSNLALALAMVGKFDDAEKMTKQAISLGSKSGSELLSRIKKLREFRDRPIDPNSFIIWQN